MAGIARIVVGIVFVLISIPFLFILIGIIPLIIGIVLIASGASARGDAERMRQQQAQTNVLLQQQMQLNAMQANRQAPAAAYAPAASYAPLAAAPLSSERYCPVCGTGNARAAAFCQKCGKPLPPPP